MIVQSIQTLINHVRDDYQKVVYKTVLDPKTMKEYVVCEVYTQRGTIEKTPDKGIEIDKQV
jgi:hypothetical protein